MNTVKLVIDFIISNKLSDKIDSREQCIDQNTKSTSSFHFKLHNRLEYDVKQIQVCFIQVFFASVVVVS